jgi:hypothetical protein
MTPRSVPVGLTTKQIGIIRGALSDYYTGLSDLGVELDADDVYLYDLFTNLHVTMLDLEPIDEQGHTQTQA